jgi:hypothetical protein
MPMLTIETIRENPWNVVTLDLPRSPTPLLLELANLAAEYCRASEYMLMLAAREGVYVPDGWEPGGHCGDVHEESQDRCHEADMQVKRIHNLLALRIGWLIEW